MIVQLGYKTLKSRRNRYHLGYKNCAAAWYKNQKPIKWEKRERIPKRNAGTATPGATGNYKIIGPSNMNESLRLKVPELRWITIQLPNLKYARHKRLHECLETHVRLIPKGKYLHFLSLPLKLSSAECKYINRGFKKRRRHKWMIWLVNEKK